MADAQKPHHVSRATRTDDDAVPGQHTLGPHVIGKRVVVRHLVRGETGPTGGPAMTDVLGTCRGWSEGYAEIERDTGSRVRIPVADIVSGKPVPPRPSVRLRMSPLEAQLRALAMWPEAHTEQLGDWVLRSAPDPVRRANSVLAMGNPGTSFASAAQRATAYYAERDRPALAMVEADSEAEAGFTDAGWVVDRPHEADTWFQVASVSRALRALRGLASGRRASMVEDGQRLEARVEDVAVARAAYDRDWLGLHALNVDPARRRQGLALDLVGTMLEWGAEKGAMTVYLQVLADNDAAIGLYGQLGFRTHHAYRYLRAPA